MNKLVQIWNFSFYLCKDLCFAWMMVSKEILRLLVITHIEERLFLTYLKCLGLNKLQLQRIKLKFVFVFRQMFKNHNKTWYLSSKSSKNFFWSNMFHHNLKFNPDSSYFLWHAISTFRRFSFRLLMTGKDFIFVLYRANLITL